MELPWLKRDNTPDSAYRGVKGLNMWKLEDRRTARIRKGHGVFLVFSCRTDLECGPLLWDKYSLQIDNQIRTAYRKFCAFPREKNIREIVQRVCVTFQSRSLTTVTRQYESSDVQYYYS